VSYIEQYRAIRNSPRFRQARRRANWQALCLVVLTPFAFAVLEICEAMGWPWLLYVPLVCGPVLAAASSLGAFIAIRRDASSYPPGTADEAHQ